MNIRNYKPILLLFMVVCVIMLNKDIAFADEVSTVKDVEYDIAGPISGNTNKYKIDTDCIKYHVKANGYDKKIGDPCPNNFIAFDNKVTVAESKTDGYGQYTFKLTSLKGFIEYCYNKNLSKTLEASTIPNEKEEDACTYAKLVNLAMSTLSAKAKTFMTFFWNTMFGLNEVFKGYQDSYFFKENTYKAIEKIKSTLHASNLSYGNLKNGSNNEENTSTMEYLTLLTTYMYSINREEKLANIGRGDLVPFLYYAENADVYDAKEIAKYAYVALIEEFLRVSGKNYWFNEYEQVFKDAYANIELDYDLETLEEWYDECYAKYKNDRGLKQNPLLGSDIETIIGSNYSISYQVDATEMYIENFFSELGIDTDFKENMARNELMARYMMENSYISDTIKDYCVEVSFISENLQRGTFEEKNSCTAVLSDFQSITFEDEISKIGSRDLDSDGVINKTELGNVKWVDITEFFNKAYNDRKANGLTSLTYEEEIKRVTEGNGEYTNLNDNKVNGHVKYEGGRVLYRTYDYKSNPALRDTDFDGIDDNTDGRPLSGNFSGQTDIERGQKLSVGYTQDYRYFFIDNNKYNDELAQMSLIISNLSNDEERKITLQQGGVTVGIMNVGGSSVGTLNITQYMEKIGFTPLTNFSLAGGKGTAYIAYKIIDYYGKEKLVLSIFIGGFSDENSYKDYILNLNDIDDRYENIVKAITNKIDELKTLSSIKKYFENENTYCYWVTGKNIGGAVANEVAVKLNNADNIYCYTFAVPNVSSNITSGEYIKTIINEDDLLPKINCEDDGYHVDGDIYNKSIYWDLIPEYKNYIGNPNNYHGNYKKTNSIKKGIIETRGTFDRENKAMLSNFIDELSMYLSNLFEKKNSKNEKSTLEQTLNNLDTLCKVEDNVLEMKEYVDEIICGNSTKAYWCLVKSIDGYDLKGYYDGDYTKYQDIIERPKVEYEELDDVNDHIYIEIDWQDGYAPNKEQLQIVVNMFKKHNIILHIDAGEYSINYDGNSESNVILNMPNRSLCSEDENFIEKIVDDNFSKRKNFRYCMYIKQYEGVNGITDNIPGRFCLFSKKSISECPYSNKEAATFMHELGHSLGLKHGGDEHTLYKPNYVSIMNYLNSYEGLLANDDVNYSEYVFPQIENFDHIDENIGIDPLNVGEGIFGIRWRLRKNNNFYEEYYQYYTDDKHIDFNLNNIVEDDVKIDFYIGYANLWSKIVSKFYKNCKQSINDWEVVEKNIIPCETIEYSTFKEKFEGDIE